MARKKYESEKRICITCGAVRFTTKEPKHGQCRKCYNEVRKEKRNLCEICGKEVDTANKGTRHCRRCWLEKFSTKFKEVDDDENFSNWIAGFVAGEGNFQLDKYGSKFRIIMHEREKDILEQIRNHLGVGEIYFRDVKKSMKNWNPKYQSDIRNNQWAYIVQSVVDQIRVIIPFFEKYPPRAYKQIQFEKWKENIRKRQAYKVLIKEVD